MITVILKQERHEIEPIPKKRKLLTNCEMTCYDVITDSGDCPCTLPKDQKDRT